MSGKRLVLILFISGIFMFFAVSGAEAVLIHRVETGENLDHIAAEYDTAVDILMQLNSYLEDPELIFAGQVLVVPEPVKDSDENIHVVEAGDSLYRLAGKYDRDVHSLLVYNDIADPGLIYPGQRLKIPPLSETVTPDDDLQPADDEETPGVEESPVIEQPADKDEPPTTLTLHQLLRYYRSSFLHSGPFETKQVALTFDDGPDAHYTPMILDVLREHGVRATFFLIGNQIERHPAVVKRIQAEGHVIGSHSWSHPNFSRLEPGDAWSEIYRTERAIFNLTGNLPALFRSPWGKVTEDNLKMLVSLGYKKIYWSVDSQDWSVKDPDQVLINILPDTRRGSIILMHSTGGRDQNLDATVAALPDLIHTLRVQGYQFVTVDELLSIPAYRN